MAKGSEANLRGHGATVFLARNQRVELLQHLLVEGRKFPREQHFAAAVDVVHEDLVLRLELREMVFADRDRMAAGVGPVFEMKIAPGLRAERRVAEDRVKKH